jgi:hypothetical protein
MRIFLTLYVIVFITLNFFVSELIVLLLAMSTFPVTVYLLVIKRKPEARQQPEKDTPLEEFTAEEERSY